MEITKEEELLSALKVIHIWASHDNSNPQTREEAMSDIANKALVAINKHYEKHTPNILR